MFISESGIHQPHPGSLYGIMKFLVARKEGRKDKPNEEGGLKDLWTANKRIW